MQILKNFLLKLQPTILSVLKISFCLMTCWCLFFNLSSCLFCLLRSLKCAITMTGNVNALPTASASGGSAGISPGVFEVIDEKIFIPISFPEFLKVFWAGLAQGCSGKRSCRLSTASCPNTKQNLSRRHYKSIYCTPLPSPNQHYSPHCAAHRQI